MTEQEKAYKKIITILDGIYSTKQLKDMEWITILGILFLNWGIKREIKKQSVL